MGRQQLQCVGHMAPEGYELGSDLTRIFGDLRRRRVFQVAAIYAAAARVIIQVADVVGPAIDMPNSVMTAIVVLSSEAR